MTQNSNYQTLIEAMFAGDKRALARLMTFVDNRHPDLVKIMAQILPKSGKARRIGITGPPGAGKSTLVDKIIRQFRDSGKTVGVVAIDPSSPFSGGAVLGDRIRMQDHGADEGVFIRSLGSHGSHGGMSQATREVVELLDAYGFDVVIIETVGVGQTELDIMNVAHTTVVVLVPESGDTIQTMKAGLMEIADIFVVNKADREGADRITAELQSLSHMYHDQKNIPVVKTEAINNRGLEELMQALEAKSAQSMPTIKTNDVFLQSRNPATGKIIGSVTVSTEFNVYESIKRAHGSLPAWKKLSFKERGQIINKARDLILNQIDELASLISNENGKPIMEAISHDIMPVMDLMSFYARQSESLLKKEKIKLGKWTFLGHQSYLEYEPWGVVGVISPWNFPFSIPTGGVVMALMVGNTVILKPSEYTPLIGQKIVELFWSAGVPRDVLQIIHGDGKIGSALIKGGVDKILFTGSVPTGKKIMAVAAETLTPVTLELGGKDPMIVTETADLELASSATVWGAFCNSGQVCASIERVYVHESIAKPFTDLVVKKTKALRQGIGDVDVGAMTAEMQIKKVEAQVADAIQRGAQILTGGSRNKNFKDGRFFEPTVLVNVDHQFPIVAEESFGPVLPIMTYQTEADAIAQANDSIYALNAYIWTGDVAGAKKMASKIEAGTVNINESVFTYALPQTPWGGPKESGLGRTHGAMGLFELVNVRHVHVNRLPSRKNNFWWYGYSNEKIEMIKALCQVLFGRGFKRVRSFVKFLILSGKVKSL